jgi:amino-acid N-acetyltransferase
MTASVLLRKAKMGDARPMHRLLSHFADKRELLPRSISEVYENLQQFHIAEDKGTIIGTCALYVTWDNLAEVKALAVDEKYQSRGIGKRLLQACLDDARRLEIRRVFTLTIRTGFFEHFGFAHVAKDSLPHKVWTECVRCIYFPERCVEYAMVKDIPGPGPTPPPVAYRDKAVLMQGLPEGTLVPSEPMVPGVSVPRPKDD